jgi:hypothetical protein
VEANRAQRQFKRFEGYRVGTCQVLGVVDEGANGNAVALLELVIASRDDLERLR